MLRRSLMLTAGLAALLAAVGQSGYAEQYTAFSLKVAQQRIEGAGETWRTEHPEVLSLAGISRVEGFVYDAEAGDLILVGEQYEGRAPLTLDDLVVALRARLRYGEWPVVSIDPTPDTEDTQMLHVRFEGGIENTAFGQTLYDADYRLKQIALGLESSGVPQLRSYWDRVAEEADPEAGPRESEVQGRFWFRPVNARVVLKEGVCVVRGLKLGLEKEVLSAKLDGKPVEDVKGFIDASADTFATDVSARFEDLCSAQPSFSRLRGLHELVAVSVALENLEAKPDMSWWLERYPLAATDTPSQARVLGRRHDEFRGWRRISGGVRLTALAMRLNAGDVSSLREAVLKVRPSVEALSWRFVAARWVIPMEPGQVSPENISSLWGEAVWLQEQGRHQDAVEVYGTLLELAPTLADAWRAKAWSELALGRYHEAITSSDRALAIGAEDTMAWLIKATANCDLGELEPALACCERALQLDPRCAPAWLCKAEIIVRQGRDLESLECYDKAIQQDPGSDGAWVGRGKALGRLKRYEDALASFSRALELKSSSAEAWIGKAAVLAGLARCEEALSCADRGLEIAPQHATGWLLKGSVLLALKRPDEARLAFERADELGLRVRETLDAVGARDR